MTGLSRSCGGACVRTRGAHVTAVMWPQADLRGTATQGGLRAADIKEGSPSSDGNAREATSMAIWSSTDVGVDHRERGTSPPASSISPLAEAAHKSRAWLWYLATGETVACISALTPPVQPIKDFILVGGSLALVGAFIAAFSLRFAGRPAPWIVLACGQAAFLIGNTILLIARVRGATLPSPSFADVFFLAAYPCFAIAMVLFLHGGRPPRDRGVLIDATIITVGAGSLIWFVSVVPLVHLTGVTVMERVWSIAYPAMDLLLLAVGVWILVDRGTRTPSARMLIASFAGLLIGDIWYGRELLQGTFQTTPVPGSPASGTSWSWLRTSSSSTSASRATSVRARQVDLSQRRS